MLFFVNTPSATRPKNSPKISFANSLPLLKVGTRPITARQGFGREQEAERGQSRGRRLYYLEPYDIFHD